MARAYANAVVAGLLASRAARMLGDWLVPFANTAGFAGMRASLLMCLFLGGLVALARLNLPAAEDRTAETAAPA